MTRYLFAAVFFLSFAQAYAQAAKPQAQSLPPPVDQTAAEQTPLQALNNKEAAEINALVEQERSTREKLTRELKDIQNKMSAVREKYRKERYALMDKEEPGSGTRLANIDKEIAAIDKKLESDLAALAKDIRAESEKGALTKEKMDGFKAARQALTEEANAKKNKLAETR